MNQPWELSESYALQFFEAMKAPPEFVQEAMERLHKGEGEYGANGYLERNCYREAQEEAIDLVNYGLFCFLTLYRDDQNCDADEIRDLVRRSTLHAIEGYKLWAQARALHAECVA